MASNYEELMLRINGDSSGGQEAIDGLVTSLKSAFENPLEAVKKLTEALGGAESALSKRITTLVRSEPHRPINNDCVRACASVGLIVMVLLLLPGVGNTQEVRDHVNKFPAEVGNTQEARDRDRIKKFWAEVGITQEVRDYVNKFRAELRDPSPAKRYAAVDALRHLGPAAAPAVDDLRRAVRQETEPDARVRAVAVDALRYLDAAAAPAVDDLRRAVRPETEPEADVRRMAAYALGDLGPVVAAPAVDDLRRAVRQETEPDADVRSTAALALGHLGSAAAPAVDDLRHAVRPETEPEAGVRAQAAVALGALGPVAAPAVDDLRRAVRPETEPEAGVRRMATIALGDLGPVAARGVDDLGRAVRRETEPDGMVRIGAVEALTKLASVAAPAVDDLRHAVRQATEPDRGVRGMAANALLAISAAIDRTTRTRSNAEIRAGVAQLNRIATDLAEFPSIKVSVEAHRDALNGALQTFRLWPFLEERWRWLLAPGYAAVMLSAWLIVLWRKPVSLLALNEHMRPYVDLKIKWPVEMTLPLRHLLLLQVFNYRPRVLDAWVQARVGVARRQFSMLPTVKARSIYVALPSFLDQQLIPELNSASLCPIFGRQIACLLIVGEGGSGKTSLACQIGRWAFSEDSAARLAPQLMLPVIIEDEIAGSLLDAVRRNLQILVDEKEPIPDELCEQLLRSKRLLVIVDHLSELSDATRTKITPESPAFPVNALVVTSRLDERLGGVSRSVIQPTRLKRDRLAPFMSAYLTAAGKNELFTDDEFHRALGRLASMVQGDGRDVTVLLGILYAKQMIASKEGHVSTVPESIPDLMLGYLNQLNISISEPRKSDVLVHTDAMALAWACVRGNFVPGYIPFPTAREALGGSDVDDRLRYLERRLQILQTAQPAQDRIRFLLDPLAEYLAGLWLVEHYGHDEALWNGFFGQTSVAPGGSERIGGFLLALRDCCMSHNDAVPEWVASRIAQAVAP
jgi:hypothetical protein